MDFDLTGLHPDVERAIRPHLAREVSPVLDQISTFISGRRDEARDGRVASGAEAIWRYCEEAYAGIDDANRSEFEASKWHKPQTSDGPLTTGAGPQDNDKRSTVFVRLSARYVDAGAAKLSEILLPPDDKAFSITEVPDPDLIRAKGDDRQVLQDGTGVPLTRNARPGETPPQIGQDTGGQSSVPAGGAPPSLGPVPPAPGVGVSPPPAAGAGPSNVLPFPGGQTGGVPGMPGAAPQPPQMPLTVGDLAQENIEFARAKAKRAEDRILRWMTESNFIAENRKVIKESAKLGVGVLKAPYPKVLKGVKLNEDDKTVTIEEKIIPGTRAISVWNFFPDPTCGENVHDGEYVFERDDITEKQLRDLAKLPGYIASQIEKVIAEGPDKINTREIDSKPPGAQDARSIRNEKYSVWYYHGTLKRDEVEAIELAQGKRVSRTGDRPVHHSVYVIATLINETVIKVTFNPLDSGKFPYHAMPWQPRASSWFGVGVTEQVMSPQRMLNAGVRAMMDNAGVSAGSQIIIDQTAVYPADGEWLLSPNKIWYKTGENVESVEDAFQIFNIPNMTRQILEMIEFFMRLAEESTSIPLITQGQAGTTTPDTLGATQLQNNNANSLLRSIGYIYDDYITEPAVYQFYEWYLLDPDVDDDDKAMFHIAAHGSVTLVDRAIQDQTIIQLKPLVDDPKYKFDPVKYATELLKSKRFDPAAFLLTRDEQKKQDQMPKPGDPKIEVAHIQQDTALKVKMLDGKSKEATTALTQQIETAANTLEESRIHTDATVRLHEIETDKQLQLLKYANEHRMTITQAQTELARTSMTLQAQERISVMDHGMDLHHKTVEHAVDLHKHHNPPPVAEPAAEPPGKAPNGKAFER